MDEEILTPRDLRMQLGLSNYQVTQLVKSGALPAIRIGSKKNSPLRFRESDIKEWLKKSLVKAG